MLCERRANRVFMPHAAKKKCCCGPFESPSNRRPVMEPEAQQGTITVNTDGPASIPPHRQATALRGPPRPRPPASQILQRRAGGRPGKHRATAPRLGRSQHSAGKQQPAPHAVHGPSARVWPAAATASTGASRNVAPGNRDRGHAPPPPPSSSSSSGGSSTTRGPTARRRRRRRRRRAAAPPAAPPGAVHPHRERERGGGGAAAGFPPGPPRRRYHAPHIWGLPRRRQRQGPLGGAPAAVPGRRYAAPRWGHSSRWHSSLQRQPAGDAHELRRHPPLPPCAPAAAAARQACGGAGPQVLQGALLSVCLRNGWGLMEGGGLQVPMWWESYASRHVDLLLYTFATRQVIIGASFLLTINAGFIVSRFGRWGGGFE
jgi:hypothetical protein